MSGGNDPNDISMKNWYKFNFSSSELSRLADMNIARCRHGAHKFHEKIYVFGGCAADGLLKSAETYDMSQNLWVNLPDMPIASEAISTVQL